MPPRSVVRVQRTHSGTPLTRRFERPSSGELKRKDVIPWSSFDRSKYPESALALAVHAQSALALGEYGAIHLFSRLASAVSLSGAPLDIVRATAAVAADEARHAEYALRMAELCAGRSLSLELDPGKLPRNAWQPMSVEEVDACMIEVSSIGETLAAAFIGACRDAASDPVPRALFGALLADEVHHARIGWYYLTWRSPQWTLAERQRLADRAAQMIVNVEVNFWNGRDAPVGSRKAARALGVLDSKSQRAVVRDVMESEVVPALDTLGLGASHAWRARRRGRA